MRCYMGNGGLKRTAVFNRLSRTCKKYACISYSYEIQSITENVREEQRDCGH